jgi:hypothetical protein
MDRNSFLMCLKAGKSTTEVLANVEGLLGYMLI